MSLTAILLIAAAVVVVVYGVLIFNRLVEIKHNVGKAWSNIDVLLKQRHDELPKLVDTCKVHMAYEQETLARVMDARSRVSNAREQHDVRALGTAEGALRGALGNLFAVAEAYPELKASQSFVHLHARISGLEEAIADRREFYNESVNINNVRIEQFPDSLIASRGAFRPFELLKFSVEESRDHSVKQLFA